MMSGNLYTGYSQSYGPLFDQRDYRAKLMAHRDDPQSSKDCAAKAARSGITQRRRDALLKAIKGHPGLTSAEYSRVTDIDKHEARRRLTDLKNAGLIYRAGRKACSVSGGRDVSWRVVDEEL